MSGVLFRKYGCPNSLFKFPILFDNWSELCVTSWVRSAILIPRGLILLWVLPSIPKMGTHSLGAILVREDKLNSQETPIDLTESAFDTFVQLDECIIHIWGCSSGQTE